MTILESSLGHPNFAAAIGAAAAKWPFVRTANLYANKSESPQSYIEVLVDLANVTLGLLQAIKE